MVWKNKEGSGDQRVCTITSRYLCVVYRGNVPIISIDDSLIFIPYKYKIDDVYAYIQADFNIEENVELNKSIEIEMGCRPDGSIHLRQPYLTRRIINMISDMDKSNSK